MLQLSCALLAPVFTAVAQPAEYVLLCCMGRIVSSWVRAFGEKKLKGLLQGLDCAMQRYLEVQSTYICPDFDLNKIIILSCHA